MRFHPLKAGAGWRIKGWLKQGGVGLNSAPSYEDKRQGRLLQAERYRLSVKWRILPPVKNTK